MSDPTAADEPEYAPGTPAKAGAGDAAVAAAAAGTDAAVAAAAEAAGEAEEDATASELEERIARQKKLEGLDSETSRDALKFHVEDHPRWGRTAVASEDIKAGTVLLVEEPVVQWPRVYELDAPAVHDALEACNLDTWCIALPTMWAKGEVTERATAVVDDLFNPPLTDKSVARFRNSAIALHEAYEELGLNKTNIDVDMVHRLIILSLVNAHGQGEDGVAMYDVGSKIAHSCRPNCSYQSLGSTLVYRSIKDIKKGEPLNFSYLALDELVYSAHKRQEKMLEFRFFVCSCSRCEEADTARTMRCPGCETGLCIRKNPPLMDSDDLVAYRRLIEEKTEEAQEAIAAEGGAGAGEDDEDEEEDEEEATAAAVKARLDKDPAVKKAQAALDAHTPWHCNSCDKDFADKDLPVELETRLADTLVNYEGVTIFDVEKIETLHAWLAEAESELGAFHWVHGLLHKYISEWYDQDATNGSDVGSSDPASAGGSACRSGARAVAHAEKFLAFIDYIGGKEGLPGLHSRHTYYMAQICGKEAQHLMQQKHDFFEASLDNMSYIWGDTDSDIVEAREELAQLTQLGY